MKTIIVDAYSSEFLDGADFAVLQITPELEEKILRIQELVRTTEIESAQITSWCVDLVDYDGNKPDFTPAGYELQIDDNGFYWSGYAKHSDGAWNTEHIGIQSLATRETDESLIENRKGLWIPATQIMLDNETTLTEGNILLSETDKLSTILLVEDINGIECPAHSKVTSFEFCDPHGDHGDLSIEIPQHQEIGLAFIGGEDTEFFRSLDPEFLEALRANRSLKAGLPDAEEEVEAVELSL